MPLPLWQINSLEVGERVVLLKCTADSSSSLRANVVALKTGNVLEIMPLPLLQTNSLEGLQCLVLLERFS